MNAEELRALLEAATPGPWFALDEEIYGREDDGRPLLIGSLWGLSDLELAVAAVNALPDLLAERDQLREALYDLLGYATAYEDEEDWPDTLVDAKGTREHPWRHAQRALAQLDPNPVNEKSGTPE